MSISDHRRLLIEIENDTHYIIADAFGVNVYTYNLYGDMSLIERVEFPDEPAATVIFDTVGEIAATYGLI